VLAYVFWHHPLDRSAPEAYEQAQIAFHRSLAHTPPVGFRGSAVFRVSGLPWLPPAPSDETRVGAPEGAYEDWYLLEDYTALGVLNEAAVGRGHRSTHDDLARRYGGGAGGLYGLIEGHAHLDEKSLAIWVARTPGLPRRGLGEMLGDGMEPAHASLWRRQFVFGPAPEFCLLAQEPPAGVAPARLPAGWSATSYPREVLWNG
jgi:hypothetical protein